MQWMDVKRKTGWGRSYYQQIINRTLGESPHEQFLHGRGKAQTLGE